MTAGNGAGAAREFDWMLFGATGFTGKLVGEYLAKKRSGSRCAIAGRSRDKLEAVRAELALVDSAAAGWPIVVGDALDPADLEAMVRRTRVVCTTVGPYARLGRGLAAACARHGTSYCDLAGEPLFLRESIDENHDVATRTGARIVHACGFDSIPSDLGVFLLHQHFTARGDRLAEAHLRVLGMKGGPSGGTLASAMETAARAADRDNRRKLADPYLLLPDGAPRGRDGRDQTGPRFDERTGCWTGPFVMAAINTRVVRRSSALLGYGADFRYDESTETGSGARGYLRAAALSGGLGAAMVLLATPPTRSLLARFLPQPGEGPSRATRESGFFRIAVHGVGASGARATTLVVGTRDPGYGETAKMLGESTLCLAEDALTSPGGVTTPAAAMGSKLVERLRAAGMTWEVT
jgi:short subunit dehydrogenase-like uncharacterized protein